MISPSLSDLNNDTGRIPTSTHLRKNHKKIGHDWILTKQVACILLLRLGDMKCEDLARMGANMTEILTTFFQTHVISSGEQWMKMKAFEAWTAVKETLTAFLYDKAGMMHSTKETC